MPAPYTARAANDLHDRSRCPRRNESRTWARPPCGGIHQGRAPRWQSTRQAARSTTTSAAPGPAELSQPQIDVHRHYPRARAAAATRRVSTGTAVRSRCRPPPSAAHLATASTPDERRGAGGWRHWRSRPRARSPVGPRMRRRIHSSGHKQSVMPCPDEPDDGRSVLIGAQRWEMRFLPIAPRSKSAERGLERLAPPKRRAQARARRRVV